MRTMTASEVSRSFSVVLDRAEGGETIVITRGGKRVAAIGPSVAGTWRAFRTALDDWAVPDDPELADDMRAARDAVGLDEDAWASV